MQVDKNMETYERKKGFLYNWKKKNKTFLGENQLLILSKNSVWKQNEGAALDSLAFNLGGYCFIS